MADDQADTNPIEQLIELLVYAPIGLLYEYEDVLPQLVRRGRSQVQLARLLGQMAVKGRQADPSAVAGDVAGLAAGVLARAVTEFGAQVGLAPKPTPEPSAQPDTAPEAAREPQPAAEPAAFEPAPLAATDEPEAAAIEASEPEPSGPESAPLPIAGYDDLTARQIVALLGELTPAQRQRIRRYETAGRNRKTVLSKLDRLNR